ncbi:hypothetical protein [Streptomyces sp. DH12]|uniref:hypothetical protein n=1 Tax=Streptomyces sp. DH12 TaxID=2857010 RepID=UPI001E5C37DB|nr:hypothetical protein [Streptomyces sp. DH12]
MAKLATVVHVTDDKGVSHVLTPADEVPAWAASQITNPKAWAVPPASVSRLAEPDSTPSKSPAKRAAPRRKAG